MQIPWLTKICLSIILAFLTPAFVTAQEYNYREWTQGQFIIKRDYGRVPYDYSPPLTLPPPGKLMSIVMDGRSFQTNRLKWAEVYLLKEDRNIQRSFQDRQMRYPQRFGQALDARQFFLAACTYATLYNGRPAQATVLFWNALGPIPPRDIIEQSIPAIRPPIDRCPPVYPGFP